MEQIIITTHSCKESLSRSPISNREKERETAIETPVFQERAK